MTTSIRNTHVNLLRLRQRILCRQRARQDDANQRCILVPSRAAYRRWSLFVGKKGIRRNAIGVWHHRWWSKCFPVSAMSFFVWQFAGPVRRVLEVFAGRLPGGTFFRRWTKSHQGRGWSVHRRHRITFTQQRIKAFHKQIVNAEWGEGGGHKIDLFGNVKWANLEKLVLLRLVELCYFTSFRWNEIYENENRIAYWSVERKNSNLNRRQIVYAPMDWKFNNFLREPHLTGGLLSEIVKNFLFLI